MHLPAEGHLQTDQTRIVSYVRINSPTEDVHYKCLVACEGLATVVPHVASLLTFDPMGLLRFRTTNYDSGVYVSVSFTHLSISRLLLSPTLAWSC